MPPDSPTSPAAGDQAATASKGPRPSERSQRALDWLNFFIADVETAFGPFVAVYLADNGWSQGTIGTVITVNSAIALATQTPAGALVDWIRRKRLVIAVCLVCIAAGSLLIAFFPELFTGGGRRGAARHHRRRGPHCRGGHRVGVGRAPGFSYSCRAQSPLRFPRQCGDCGWLWAALGYLVSRRSPFFAAAGLCVPAAMALTFIRGGEIDYARARQAVGRKEPKAARWHELARNRGLLTFSLCLFLFQFANASMLPLAGEKLAANFQRESEVVISALVVVPQLVTAIIAAWMGRKADEWGRRPLLMAAFAALLARTVLFALASGPWFLVGVQVLGGLTAAVLGILTPLVVADCTKRSARYNFSLGAVGMISGIGATISTTAIGFVAQMMGFTVGFMVLAIVAAIGLGVLWAFMPETSPAAREED